jgi:hypothetical protein
VSDVFDPPDEVTPATDGSGAFAEKLFRTQPRLVPMALVWLSPLLILAVGGATSLMARLLPSDATASGSGAWAAFVIVVACAPWVAVCLLPVIQRRHLHNPGPFYRFCRWTSIAIATVFPVLWITGWAVAKVGPMERSSLLWAIILMYTLAAALFPIAARLNHAAWLRDNPENAWP